MASSNSTLKKLLQLAVSLFLWSCSISNVDTNTKVGSLCSSPPRADQNSSWTVNLNAVFRSLEANVTANSNNGFYKAEAGEESSGDKAYGLIQCRGDIPPLDCRDCTRDSIALAATECAVGIRTVVIWQQWCYLRYSDTSFYGVWERSGAATSTGSDDADVAAEGMEMMAALAVEAPKGAYMFGEAEVGGDVGGKKRFGLVQCTRDLDELGCGECLDHLLKGFISTIANTRRWQIHVVGCFMMYDDYRFFFNSTSVSSQTPAAPSHTPTSHPSAAPPGLARPQNASGANGAWIGRLVVGVILFATAMACF